jgi:hypothetical protein
MSSKILIIYQMGKVGSSTVHASLKDKLNDFQIYKIHDLSPDTLVIDERLYKRKWRKSRTKKDVPFHHWESQFLSKFLNCQSHGKLIKIITLVRDPIARNISSFFQTLEMEYQLSYEDLLKSNDPIKMDVLLDLFVNKVKNHEYPLHWFDNEMKRYFGIDVFDHPFPKERGYKIIKSNKIEFLIIKLECLRDNGESAFEKFLNLEKFEFTNDNVSQNKLYSFLYNDFKKNIVLPDSYINSMYKSKYVNHFYSEDEIIEMKKKWTNDY